MAKKIDKEKLSKEEIERRKILEKAEEAKEEQLKLDIDEGVGVENEYNTLLDQNIDEKGIRGSDGRMAYMEDLELAIEIVMSWISSRGTFQDLYLAFWNKNDELGYGHQD